MNRRGFLAGAGTLAAIAALKEAHAAEILLAFSFLLFPSAAFAANAALPPDHTGNADDVLCFREAAVTIAERKMSEDGAKRLSTGGNFHGFFLWDSAFAVLWARHLDGKESLCRATLDNFYRLAESDGFISREYTAEGDAVWSSNHPIAFAPPILSWAEIALYRDGKSDRARLRKVYPALKRHHEAAAKRFRRADGLYFGDLFGCGMDDIPRWPRGMSAADRVKGGILFTPDSIAPGSRKKIWDWLGGAPERFGWNRQAGWIDLSAQMAFDCLNLAEMASALGRTGESAAFAREHDEIAAALNAKCWDEEKGFYFDVTDGGRIERYLAAAYWTLLAKVPSETQAKRMVEKLFDPKYFGAPVMIPSLARSDADYNPEHGYWTGPVWPPTTYMTICALRTYGFDQEAETVAKRWYNGLYEIFLKTGTLYENASPEQWAEQKGWSQPDFCGWTALAPIALPAEFGWGMSAGPRVFRIGGHSHTCRTADGKQDVVEKNIAEWAARNKVDAMGLGSPWTAENAKTTVYVEKEWRDNYYAGVTNGQKRVFDPEDVEAMVRRVNSAPGNKTLYYLDNETPKQAYGHLWHVGFKLTVPNWHDYDQGILNAPRRSYREVVDEQRAAGAICVWAHPTSWWTTNGDPNGPFTTNIAAEMLPELMEDGYLDGLTVVGYDAYHRDYQALWFALLDRGYRVPCFAELDISFYHNTTSWDTSFFNLLPDDGKTKLTEEWIVKEFKAAHHTASSGPVVFLTVDGVRQGGEIASGAGKTHRVSIVGWPAPGEKKLSKVELVGRGGEVLSTLRDWKGGTFLTTIAGKDAGGYLVVRVFGENDGDYAYKPQQHVRHCALTNPVWLRTPAFQPPAPIRTKVDHMKNPKVRELMDYLAKGLFRKDYYKGCTPGVVPISAWRIDEMADALKSSASVNEKVEVSLPSDPR